MLDWLQRGQDVNALIARRNFPKAIKVLEQQLTRQPGSVRLRQQLGDVLGRAGQKSRAIEVLMPLVDEFAEEGFVAKAIAVLKKIQRLEPEGENIGDRLASLVKQLELEDTETGVPLIRGHVPPPAAAPAEPREELGEAELAARAAADAEAERRAAAELDAVAEAAVAVARAGAAEGRRLLSKDGETEPPIGTSEVVSDWFESATAAGTEFNWSPLFKGFSKSELAAVIGGLRLLVKRPGAIIYGQYEPGTSLFILASGFARAYRRTSAGKYEQFAVLREGEFFGEASVLTGRPRNATITAATHCELLELDRETFEDIARQYPRVREVLEDFHENRTRSDVSTVFELSLEDLDEEL